MIPTAGVPGPRWPASHPFELSAVENFFNRFLRINKQDAVAKIFPHEGGFFRDNHAGRGEGFEVAVYGRSGVKLLFVVQKKRNPSGLHNVLYVSDAT
jgi:hypothetical protein